MSTIINDFLYLGSINDACTPSILNQLKITHLINLSLTRIVLEESFELLHLPLYDRFDESIITYFKQANQFIEKCRQNENGRCLVFFVIGYLIEHHGHTVPSAYLLLSNIRPTISPNRNYINQLIKYSSQTELTRCPFISS
ncbi:unnamed protein product [Rotaria magnacalcarata]|uniref:protein-tyrosine-phosphatase n=1 Tax=Rotaria magnacalcarata TaxID=392030 RepID=A0A820L6K0_9BILA|nr:unnamed protein product [Rotaria magnacalcarata]CAF3846567.1 unnamed protein product [Rotaria magnacalcarata]CAF3851672.1 unnamed protein product [Rotaria magnacalcarata]CAF3916560.1 unnamed protein product [Rotaria magnacalcarata]CAF4351729.1 unnamed protein product [Rotaria magnacalcarata]